MAGRYHLSHWNNPCLMISDQSPHTYATSSFYPDDKLKLNP